MNESSPETRFAETLEGLLTNTSLPRETLLLFIRGLLAAGLLEPDRQSETGVRWSPEVVRFMDEHVHELEAFDALTPAAKASLLAAFLQGNDGGTSNTD
jgi:hypothetical protein